MLVWVCEFIEWYGCVGVCVWMMWVVYLHWCVYGFVDVWVVCGCMSVWVYGLCVNWCVGVWVCEWFGYMNGGFLWVGVCVCVGGWVGV